MQDENLESPRSEDRSELQRSIDLANEWANDERARLSGLKPEHDRRVVLVYGVGDYGKNASPQSLVSEPFSWLIAHSHGSRIAMELGSDAISTPEHSEQEVQTGNTLVAADRIVELTSPLSASLCRRLGRLLPGSFKDGFELALSDVIEECADELLVLLQNSPTADPSVVLARCRWLAAKAACDTFVAGVLGRVTSLLVGAVKRL